MRVSEKRESDVGEDDEMKNSGDIQMWGKNSGEKRFSNREKRDK